MLEVLDIEQTIKVDVDCYFYFEPKEKIQTESAQNVRFENIEKPSWFPHFDFANEVEEVLVTDESFWLE